MKYFEDIQTGETYFLGSKTVLLEDVIGFASQFDRLPFHLDQDKAKQSIYGGLIASGLHTLSLAASIVVDEFLVERSMQGGLGISSLRWLHPVRPHDSISVVLSVLEKAPLSQRTDLGRVRVRLDVRNQLNLTVMSADVDYLFGTRGEPR